MVVVVVGGWALDVDVGVGGLSLCWERRRLLPWERWRGKRS